MGFKSFPISAGAFRIGHGFIVDAWSAYLAFRCRRFRCVSLRFVAGFFVAGLDRFWRGGGFPLDGPGFGFSLLTEPDFAAGGLHAAVTSLGIRAARQAHGDP
jgi:uncharacterized membrane protein